MQGATTGASAISARADRDAARSPHARPTRAALATAAVLAALTGLAPPAASSAAQIGSVEIVASREGFRPKVVNLRKGEAVRFQLSTADEEHCFAVDALRIEKRIVPGRSTSFDLTPERVGSFPFHCCLEPSSQAQHGRLVVIE
jgi:plastocyanin